MGHLRSPALTLILDAPPLGYLSLRLVLQSLKWVVQVDLERVIVQFCLGDTTNLQLSGSQALKRLESRMSCVTSSA